MRFDYGPPNEACRKQCQEIRRHHSEGIFLCECIFGVAITNSEGKQVPVRYIGEQHVKEDLGRIPTAQDWLSQIRPQRWMYGQPLEHAVSKT
jgi:hypothetical protein